MSGKPSLLTVAAVPRIRARVSSGRNLGQPAEVMRPALRVPGALLRIRQASLGQA